MSVAGLLGPHVHVPMGVCQWGKMGAVDKERSYCVIQVKGANGLKLGGCHGNREAGWT